MAKKKPVQEEDDFDELPDDSFDEYEEIEFKKMSHKRISNARRRHEQLKEEKALERLLGDDFNDWDNNDDWGYGDDLHDQNY